MATEDAEPSIFSCRQWPETFAFNGKLNRTLGRDRHAKVNTKLANQLWFSRISSFMRLLIALFVTYRAQWKLIYVRDHARFSTDM